MTRADILIALPMIAIIAGCSKEPTNAKTAGDENAPVISATFESQYPRTSLTDEVFGDVTWDKGDNINLFTGAGEGNNLKYTTAEGGKTAVFKKADDESKPSSASSQYVGIYPYNAAATYDGTEVSTIIPAVQTAVKGTFDPQAFISAGKSSTESIGFYNVCGGIRFTLEDPDITAVVLKGCSDETLAGPVNITFDSNNIAVASEVGNGTTEVTLTSASGMGSDEESFYYISIIPQTFSKGFTLEFYKGSSIYSLCTCEIPVTISAGTFTTIRKADNPETLGAYMDGTDLSSEAGSANCYIVSKAGTYKFPAVIGNGSEKIYPAYVKVLWETDNSEIAVAPKEIIERCNYKGSYIHFATPKNIRNGNALIAAFDEYDHILWSWHIWVCEGYKPNIGSQLYQGGTYSYMDRNLGALSNESEDPLSCGLLYQWGRKDPFLGAANLNYDARMASTGEWSTARNTDTAGSYYYCKEHPMTFYMMVPECSNQWYYAGVETGSWGRTKTVNDPCPPGWRVPENGSAGSTAWNIGNDNYGTMNKGGFFLLYGGTGKAWYPAGGYLDSGTGGLTGAGSNAFYWSATVNSGKVNQLAISSTELTPSVETAKLTDGCSVRCVK